LGTAAVIVQLGTAAVIGSVFSSEVNSGNGGSKRQTKKNREIKGG